MKVNKQANKQHFTMFHWEVGFVIFHIKHSLIHIVLNYYTNSVIIYNINVKPSKFCKLRKFPAQNLISILKQMFTINI